MALIVNDRVKENSTTTGTGTFNLDGAVTGFDTFVAGIGDTNTTYYAIFLQGSTEWEVGLGTVTDAATDTLARTTVITSSNSDSAVNFSAGTKDVFCTLPASKVVFGKQEGTNFTDSLLVGHSTTGTLNTASGNTGVGIDALDALTSGDNNVGIGFLAGSAINTGSTNVIMGKQAGDAITGGNSNVAIGALALSAAATSSNVAVGAYSLHSVTGSSNVGVGQNAGVYIAGGDFNICLGQLSGDNITTGSGNVVIGNADVSSATADDQLSISDGEDGTVVWMTGDSSGNVIHAGTTHSAGGQLTTTGISLVFGF